MGYEACISAIQAAAGGKLTDDQVGEILDDLIKRKRRILGESPLKGDAEARSQAAKELSEEARIAALALILSSLITARQVTPTRKWLFLTRIKSTQSILSQAADRQDSLQTLGLPRSRRASLIASRPRPTAPRRRRKAARASRCRTARTRLASR